MSYRKKHIKNKIHKITPKKSILRRPIFWIIFFVAVVFSAGVYFSIFFSGVQIKSILISGDGAIQTKDIENIISGNIENNFFNIGGWSITSKSIFLVNPQKLQQLILNNFPTIQSAIVERQLPQNLSIRIEGKKPVAVFCRQITATVSTASTENSAPAEAVTESATVKEECFFIDKIGVIFKEAQNVLQDMPILRQLSDSKETYIGENVIGKDVMNVILKIEKNLKDNFQINVMDALITSPLRLDIKTNERWQIYFDLGTDTDLQITKLNALLKDEAFQTNRASLQYVDLRFKDRAYYK